MQDSQMRIYDFLCVRLKRELIIGSWELKSQNEALFTISMGSE